MTESHRAGTPRPHTLTSKEGPLLLARHLRHEQPVGQPFLEVSDHRPLAPWDRDREHIASGRPELNDVGAVILGAICGCGRARSCLQLVDSQQSAQFPNVLAFDIAGFI